MRKSVIYTYSDEEFSSLVSSSNSIADLMRKVKLSEKGANRKTLRKRIDDLSIDTGQFRHGGFGKAPSNKIPLNEILVEDSDYQTGKLKKRLISDGLLVNSCSICDQSPSWNGNDLVLILDHINGNSRDHRIENLRIVCPNCDTQLPTFKGRNRKV